MDVERPDNLETTALGAAYAAGVGAGIWTEEWVMQQRATAPAGKQLHKVFRPQVGLARLLSGCSSRVSSAEVCRWTRGAWLRGTAGGARRWGEHWSWTTWWTRPDTLPYLL